MNLNFKKVIYLSLLLVGGTAFADLPQKNGLDVYQNQVSATASPQSASVGKTVPESVQPSPAQPQAQPAPAPDNAKSARQPQANQPGKSAPSAPSMADYCRENTC